MQLAGRFWVFFLSHTAPGFQLWFYFHLCMWVVHWGLLLRLPWRAWVCPCEGQVWRWCSCLGCRGSGHTKYSGVLAATAAENNSVLEGHGNQYWPVRPSILAWRTPLTEKPSRPQSTGLERVGHDRSNPVSTDSRFFLLPVAALHEGGTAAWLAGTLVVQSVQGHGLPPLQELWPFL